MYHRVEKCFGFKQQEDSTKKNVGGSIGKREGAVKPFQKSKNKFKKEMKYLKKQNKIIYSITKKSVCLK